MNEKQNINIVCFSDIWWDNIWQRHQNIMTRFPKSWKILFIEPTSIPILIKEPKRIFLRKKDNIIIASLPSLPLVDKIKSLRCINDNLILLWLKIILKLKNMKEPVLFYYEPRFSCLIEKINKKLVIYDCIDDKLAFSNVSKWMKIYIDILIEKANIIFVTSSNLQKKIEEKRKNNIYLIGNGVDVEHFKKAMDDINVPDDIKNIKKPIIGYIGAIDEWFDFDIIRDISDTHPDISIVLLGPVYPKARNEVNSLKDHNNIFFIGKRSYDILPNYLKIFDIGIIPFKINELTLSVNPVKLYEYLASGKNVISTNIPEASKYNNVICVAKDKREFVDYVKHVLYKKPDLYNTLKIAGEHTWNSKAENMTMLMLKVME